MSRFEHKVLGGVAGLAQVVPLVDLVVETPAGAGGRKPARRAGHADGELGRDDGANDPHAAGPSRQGQTVAVTGAVLLSPLGALLAGPALEAFPLDTVLVATMLAMTASMLLIAVTGFRHRHAHAPYAGDAAPGFAVQEPDG